MNPFRVAEKIGKVVGKVLMWVLIASSVALLFAAGVALAVKEGWGWWSLLVIPAIPFALALIGLLVACWYMLSDVISKAWRGAKYRWDNDHRGAA